MFPVDDTHERNFKKGLVADEHNPIEVVYVGRSRDWGLLFAGLRLASTLFSGRPGLKTVVDYRRELIDGESTMYFALISSVFAVGLFLGMVLLLEVGRRIGVERLARDPDSARVGLGAIEGAIFGLMGLLIAFTFSGAASRFDTRRQLIVEETNAIGTAYLRLDLLPVGVQPALRDRFREYVDKRLAAYRALPNIQAARARLEEANALQREIWRQAVAGCQTTDSPAPTMLLLPALNQMIDITTTRTMAAEMHPPMVVFGMLAVLALLSSLLAGYGMASGRTRSWIHMIGFAAIMAITTYVILDIEYPRLGLIRVDLFDQALVDLQQGMK